MLSRNNLKAQGLQMTPEHLCMLFESGPQVLTLYHDLQGLEGRSRDDRG